MHLSTHEARIKTSDFDSFGLDVFGHCILVSRIGVLSILILEVIIPRSILLMCTYSLGWSGLLV